MAWRLAVAAAVEAVAAGAYVGVAILLGRKRVTAGAHGGQRAFVVWWWSIAFYGATLAVISLLVAQGPFQGESALLVHAARLAALAIGATGLATYVTFLYTGRQHLLWPFAVYYGALALWAWSMAARHAPVGFVADSWYAQVEYAGRVPSWEVSALVVLYFLPLLGGTAMYLGLVRKLADAQQRRRVILVAGGLLAWGLSALAAQFTHHDLAILAAVVGMGILSAIAVLVAYARE